MWLEALEDGRNLDHNNICNDIKHSFWLPSSCCFGPQVTGGKAPKEAPKVAAAWVTVACYVELVATGHVKYGGSKGTTIRWLVCKCQSDLLTVKYKKFIIEDLSPKRSAN